MENIRNYRMSCLLAFMKEKQLDGVLFSNCALGNWNTWLLASEDMPLHLPYNRNNLCLVEASGQVSQYCTREPHPTDWGKFPVMTDCDLPEGLKGGRLGLVNPTYLKKTLRDDLLARLGVTFVDVSDEIHLLKASKSPDEIQGLKKAAEGFETAFRTLPLLLTGEPLEREVVVRLRNRLRELDAECEDLMTSSMVTLTSAPEGEGSAAEPLTYPGRRIGYGDRVNIAVNGFMPGGFAGALGRCYVLGEASQQTREAWELAVKAQDTLAERARPGTTIRELMQVLESELLSPRGLEADRSAQIYGIGASVYEPPRNTDSTRDVPLGEGMALVIAPKICFPGMDPFCCMDVFVVTADGAKRLGNMPRTLVELD